GERTQVRLARKQDQRNEMKDQTKGLDDASGQTEQRRAERQRSVDWFVEAVEQRRDHELGRDSDQRGGKTRQEQPFVRLDVGRGCCSVATDEQLGEDVKQVQSRRREDEITDAHHPARKLRAKALRT